MARPFSQTSEREYNARLAVPDHMRWLTAWKDESAQARSTLKAHQCDLRFDPSTNGTIDFFPASGASAKKPCLIFIHGGYWRSMDKSDFSFIAPPWVARGANVLIPNYMLCPQASLENIVIQIRACYQWVLHQSERLNIDQSRLLLVGHSAGAHLAAMILADSNLKGPASLLGLSGIYDLLPLTQTSINHDLGLDDIAAKALSPQYVPRPKKNYRLQLYAGALESSAFHQQNAQFAAAWGAEVQGTLSGLHHFSVLDPLKDPTTLLFRNCEDLLFSSL